MMGISNARVGKNEAQKILDDTGLSDNAISFIKKFNTSWGNIINILCGDNLPKSQKDSLVSNFFSAIALYLLYSMRAEMHPDDAYKDYGPTELAYDTWEAGIMIPYELAAEFFLQRAKKSLSIILENSIDTILYSFSNGDSEPFLYVKILSQIKAKFEKNTQNIEYQKEIMDFVKIINESHKNDTMTKEQYLQLLRDIEQKEGDNNGNSTKKG